MVVHTRCPLYHDQPKPHKEREVKFNRLSGYFKKYTEVRGNGVKVHLDACTNHLNACDFYFLIYDK